MSHNVTHLSFTGWAGYYSFQERAYMDWMLSFIAWFVDLVCPFLYYFSLPPYIWLIEISEILLACWTSCVKCIGFKQEKNGPLTVSAGINYITQRLFLFFFRFSALNLCTWATVDQFWSAHTASCTSKSLIYISVWSIHQRIYVHFINVCPTGKWTNIMCWYWREVG